MTEALSRAEKAVLLQLARHGLEAAVRGQAAPPLEPEQRTPALERLACSFVTLTELSELRGCIGGLLAEQPLWRDVQRRAGQAALDDYRFRPVQTDELADIEIEVSVLTEPVLLAYDSPADLLHRLRPQVDGVVLRQGLHRATFLPQVWETVPQPERFLALLCQKLGADPEAWQHVHLEVETYQVTAFRESDFKAQPGIDHPTARPTA